VTPVRHRTLDQSGVGPYDLLTVDDMDPHDVAHDALSSWQSAFAAARVEPLPTATNPIWSIITEDDRRFVLKELPEYPPGVGLVDEFRVLSYLSGAGIPVVLPVATDHATLSATVGQKHYSLLPWADSDDRNHELDPDAALTARSIGSAIASMDAALAACPWQPESFHDDPAGEMLEEGWPQLPEVASLIAPLRDDLYAEVKGLPTQRTHGDTNTGNVLVRGTTVSAFLDFDHLPTGPRVRDLSRYLASRLRQHLTQEATAERDAAAWVAALGDYTAGYDETYPLSSQEVAAIVPLLLLVEIGFTSWCVHGWVPDPAGYQQGIRAIRWLAPRLQELTAASTQVVPTPL
jgi:Ser/Thr protein kinase RdoA (MazF antagonist)